ncbi:holo-ACP synthase [Paenisporosarcina cavernae]|uniref:Holo-[acyl-carrier-protein] synthase n=1 Tax=Paenisporosarcina cavernae TaxID=2320858 RepID=A0A385YWT5_9BACL|nr:holo-ACP synthase [Paenisporosarcina cavernae]AYC30367.1 holo-ACP synthase [Paenisporosarcina cavernae]
MITGIGLDIVEIPRIRELLLKSDKFYRRILTGAEQEMWKDFSDSRKVEFLAGRFAAKEAFVKAVGTGIGIEYSFQDIEIQKEATGKPFLVVKKKKVNGFVSITHSKEFAAAQVILVE